MRKLRFWGTWTRILAVLTDCSSVPGALLTRLRFLRRVYAYHLRKDSPCTLRKRSPGCGGFVQIHELNNLQIFSPVRYITALIVILKSLRLTIYIASPFPKRISNLVSLMVFEPDIALEFHPNKASCQQYEPIKTPSMPLVIISSRSLK